jgi:prolyl oligopeptidase
MTLPCGLPDWSGAIFLGSLLALATAAADSQSSTIPPVTAPPVAPIRPITEEYFGVTVTDPYRYIENLKDPNVDAWFKGQDAYTRAVLAKIPGRDSLLARIRELDRSTPAKVSHLNLGPGHRYFYEKMLPNELVAKLYVRNGLDGAERSLLDPEKYPAPEGSHNAISDYSPSWDGKLVGVSVSPGGSEIGIVHILDVETGKELPETFDRVRFGSVAWLPDNHAFIYNRLQKLARGQPETDFEKKSIDYLHVLGTPAEKDVPVLGFGISTRVEVSETDIPFVFATTSDTKWMIALLAHGVLNEVSLYKVPVDQIGKPNTAWEKICDVPDAVTNFATKGDDLYLLTHKGASHFKVLKTSLAHPDMADAPVVIPEGEQVIKNISSAADGLYVQESEGALGLFKRLRFDDGRLEDIPLPFEGTVAIEASDERFAGALVDAGSWARGHRIYELDQNKAKLTDTKLQPLGPNDDPQGVISEELNVPSWDGTTVELSVVHKRGLKMDGSSPTLLEGYGSYGISIDPYFSPVLLAWIEKGGVYAWAHPRGGGEFGEDWHKGGQKLTKPNTWRDYIACAEYLVAKGYTSSAKLGSEGTSAGGITIGRTITERPDLFAAVLDSVGVSNALRGEETPNGPPNIPEFGTVKDHWGFEDLYAMDAYQHVRDGVHYPAVLLTTGWNDPRVASWEPGKMTARLQAASKSGKEVLLRVDYGGGHGMGSTKEQQEEETADKWSFLLWQFGEPDFQPGGPAAAQK